MRVALVVQQFPPALGGVERHVGELARGLSERGVDVEVITCDPTRLLPREETNHGVLIHRFPTVANDGVFFISPSLVAWLLRNARRFSLVHAHSYHTPVALEGLIAARRAGIPFVLTPHYHGTGHTAFRRALHVPYGIFGRALVRGARPVIAVSDAEAALLQEDFGSDLRPLVAPNGVDVEEIVDAASLDGDAHGKVILAAGRLERYKQIDRVVEALPSLPEEYRLVVLGSGPEHDALARLAGAMNLGDRVNVLGHVTTPELHRWYRTAETLVTLSRHEAFGMTLLEAAVAGAGVVASDIPAHREVARYVPPDRVTMVSPDASGPDVAAAIRRATRREVGRDELERVPRWRDTVARTLEGYDLALSSGRRSRGSPE